ncbi:MAG TPA: glucoamylase family protein [Clostridiales bacterium]|nr:glucoamylase family protein [Clostridiales bacterium]
MIFFIIASSYVILTGGIIIYLLLRLHSRRHRSCAEMKGTALDDEELRRHAEEMARSHPPGKHTRSLNWLIRRLNENYSLIYGIYRELSRDVRESLPTPLSAEWLLDNFYIIEEQVKLIRRNLSKRYSRLPVLKSGYYRGYPRVYSIALEIVAHTSGSIDEKSITSFIQAYQTHSLLSMCELWAMPLMLRIALIESIRETCEAIKASRQEWRSAEMLVQRIVDEGANEQKIDRILKDELDTAKIITPSFAEHLTSRLRKHGKIASTVTALLDQRLKSEGLTTADLTMAEHKSQAETQVAIGNSITGLRLVSELDWSDIFESLSRTEQILREDPNGVYALMDFESRDYFRHEVEKLARAFGIPETQVAEKAVECAREGGDSPKDHVGFYLAGNGRKILLERIGKTVRRRWRFRFSPLAKPKRLYVGMIVCMTAFMAAYFMYYAWTKAQSLPVTAVAGILVLLPCTELALRFTNTIISHLYSPVLLPKLELRNGIPEEYATFVIIPALLTSPEQAEELVRQMEVYYLANRETNLFFALVGDFRDASSETLDTDGAITEAALEAVRELNEKYSGGGRQIFYYLHRSRKYNSSQDRWMGWERKRGAIIEFNRLLRGAQDTSFGIISGDMSALPHIRYVITLDADTCLPMGAAKRLIGAMAHPLNRAVFNEATGKVEEGYGILQPRISVSIPGANRSLFTRIFAGQGGIDPYTTAVSDIYQDIFDEGIFTGKGIYDVDVFAVALHDSIPDNTVLSHDLLEGCYLRAGLVSDIELVDGYPGSYGSYAARLHRWVRGDWQLLPWLGRHVRDRSGNRVRNNISCLSKWKILDNMRRSLLSPALFALFVAGLLFLPGNAFVWTGFAAAVAAAPLLNGLLNSLLSGSFSFAESGTKTAAISGMKAAVCQSVLIFMLIPHQTYLMLDAVIRTLYRVVFSHKNMLEWVTAADTEARSKNSLPGYFRKMWFSVPSSLICLLSAAANPQRNPAPAIGAALAWLAAPVAAYLISRPTARKQSRLRDEDIAMLRRLSRKTWRFFEDFSAEEDNYLPPDNHQLDPPKGTAHRTSPTNIGLLLLSVLSAHDLGYISADGLAARTGNIVSTLEKMEKWKGHLYNWYDTRTLEILRPRYVSTVDSGNLVGYLMVLREGLTEYRGKRVPCIAAAEGLQDTVSIICSEVRSGAKSGTGIGTDARMGESMHKRAESGYSDARKGTNGGPADRTADGTAAGKSGGMFSLMVSEMERDARDILSNLSAEGDSDVRVWETGLRALASWTGRMRQAVLYPQDIENLQDAKKPDGVKGPDGMENRDSVKNAEGMENPDDGWIGRLDAMIGEFTQELYSYYPLLRLPGSAEYIGRFDAALAGELFVPASPDELLARYRKAEAALMAGSAPGTVKEGAASGDVDDGPAPVSVKSGSLPWNAAGTADDTAEKKKAKDEGAAMKDDTAESDALHVQVLDLLAQGIRHIEEMTGRYDDLIRRISEIVDRTEFAPLFDRKRLLFSIGYNAEEGRLSKSYYDLLASEARQASFIAIARGEVDRKHWMRLGRKMTAADGGMGLVSWTGTMFEYLMPALIMRSYENTVLDETYSFVVKMQKKYGRQRNIPWGISESGYSALDFRLNYQYRAFGVPELGLKRGLANDMVTAPYASLLALTKDPAAVAENLRELQKLGMEGTYGFYEAVDFTPSRLDKNSRFSIVKSYMAHHQGMSLASLNNFFNRDILQKRFHNIPVIRSAELLLQEKMPERILYAKEYREERAGRVKRTEHAEGMAIRTYGMPKHLPPNVHLLSNGEYTVMITDGGSGYSRAGAIAVNRWVPDYFEKKGFYIFIQNVNSNTAWSATSEPYGQEPEKYRVVFSPDRAEFIRRNGNIESRLEVTVSPEDNAEVRRITLTNHSEHSRIIELTSYFEAVAGPWQEDAAHPAFSKLFVRTEYVRDHKCLLAVRRPRKEGEKPVWLVHAMSVEEDHAIGEMQFETDRMRFIGRNRDITNAEALEPDQPLSGSQGPVLDPVMSLRRRLRIEPGGSVRAVYSVALASSRKEALELADKYNDFRISDRTFELAWTRSRVENRYLGLAPDDVVSYLDMVPFLLYGSSFRKAYAKHIESNTCSQQDLWTFGISGDLPIMLAVLEAEDEDILDWILKGHEYLRMKGLYTDLVVLINKVEGYNQPLNEKVRNAIAASHARELSGKPGGVYVINSSDIGPQQISLLYTAARLVVEESPEVFTGRLRESRLVAEAMPAASACFDSEKRSQIKVHDMPEEEELQFFNGIGGFSRDGTEYVIRLGGGRRTPLPWSNIIANRDFGFLVTESGGGYTWYKNSREFKLTPWANDPVTDRQGEIFYVSDLDEKCHWSLTPMPIGGSGIYTVRHGFGYSVFEHESNGIRQSLTMFAASELPVKVCIIALKNLTGRQRRLRVTYYLRPVLGVTDSQTSPFIVTRADSNGMLCIENRFSRDFRDRIVFLASNLGGMSYTGDRALFIGHGGDVAEPAGLSGENLNEVTGAGLDPCAAISCIAEPAPEEEAVIVFLFGCAGSMEEARSMKDLLARPENAKAELEKAKGFWREKLGAIRLQTPDDSFDTIMNGWLLYQTIACRLWARSAYYQAGGAYGFRDQLQDCMALLNIWPELSREQILLHASRQFKEGDVQHWWHAERGNGIRTRYSDDLLWLAYVTAEYLEKTGDDSVLYESVPFLEGNLLAEGEHERYEEPRQADIAASLYDHCVLAIDISLRTGPHGLPLIGSGDWNDGMNTVGSKGTGESVWLAWFLLTILHRFIPICLRMKDFRRAETYREKAAMLIESIEREAWDGSWYRRAYFDDGTPLGSARNSECMIDSISQSWAVISGMAKPARAREAIEAVKKFLVDEDEGIVKLLTPPFDDGVLQPGYIKGYLPGVRENGGQYTHAAVWVVMAFARLGLGNKAGEIFHMLNPINHTRTAIEYSRYKTEPYVIAADVYAASPHVGRGGWTWYTGAAGWLYRVGLENIAGFRKKGEKLYIDPCIPESWKEFRITYRYKNAVYIIEIRNPDGACSGVSHLVVDGQISREGFIELSPEGVHNVEVIMGTPYHVPAGPEPDEACPDGTDAEGPENE